MHEFWGDGMGVGEGFKEYFPFLAKNGSYEENFDYFGQ